MCRSLFAVIACFVAALGTVHTVAAEPPVVRVFVAASMQDAVKEIADDYSAKHDVKLTLSAGASNALATQIIKGAPAQIFISANEEWAAKLVEEKLAGDVRKLVGNSLVLAVPKSNPGKIRKAGDLTGDAVRKIVLAGENVPAGKYGGQALKAADVLDNLQAAKRIVRAQDVRAALTFIEREEVEGGIVYATDVRVAKNVETAFTFDPQTHDPIVYPMVLTNEGQKLEAASKFFEHLNSEAAQAVYRKHGFTPIGGEKK